MKDELSIPKVLNVFLVILVLVLGNGCHELYQKNKQLESNLNEVAVITEVVIQKCMEIESELNAMKRREGTI